MDIQIVGLQRDDLAAYIREKYSDLNIVEENPEVVVCYGGDGTLLYGEGKFPGVPKVMVRHSRVCALCQEETRDTVLRLLSAGEYTIVPHMKLAVKALGQTLHALNDVVIAHKFINNTLRAKVFVNGEQYGSELFGDGVVVSTPLGSTGYYQSITRSNFTQGIGIAFNNSINTVSHLVVQEEYVIDVEVTRGPGLIAADNNEEQITVETGDRARIRIAKEQAQIIRFGQEYMRFNVNTGADRVQLGYCQVCRKPYTA